MGTRLLSTLEARRSGLDADDDTPGIARALARLEAKAGLEGVTEALATRLSGADLRVLLAEVLRRRAGARTPAEVLRDFQRDPYVRALELCPREMARWAEALFDACPADTLRRTLSPVAPLGACVAVSGDDQGRILSTARLTEVVPDTTNVLALEAARLRRSGDPSVPVHLAAHHRVLRQPLYRGQGMQQHFHLFGLVSAGRAAGPGGFEVAATLRQVRVLLRALQTYLGQRLRARFVLSDLTRGRLAEALEAGVLAPLRADFAEGLEAALDLERTRAAHYYDRVAFLLHVQGADGDWVEVADGGSVPWVGRLLSRGKERCMTSALGSDRVVGLKG